MNFVTYDQLTVEQQQKVDIEAIRFSVDIDHNIRAKTWSIRTTVRLPDGTMSNARSRAKKMPLQIDDVVRHAQEAGTACMRRLAVYYQQKERM